MRWPAIGARRPSVRVAQLCPGLEADDAVHLNAIVLLEFANSCQHRVVEFSGLGKFEQVLGVFHPTILAVVAKAQGRFLLPVRRQEVWLLLGCRRYRWSDDGRGQRRGQGRSHWTATAAGDGEGERNIFISLARLRQGFEAGGLRNERALGRI